MRTVVRFDRLLTALHLEGDDNATRCGEPMPKDDTRVIWIDWPEDGTPHCPTCFGEALQEDAMF